MKITSKHTQAPVDIIIPFYGHYHLLRECLSGILTKTLVQKYTLTLVDDCSPNKQFGKDLNKEKQKIRINYIRHDSQKGFGVSLATGFNATHNPWVCFMHADCCPTKTNWLSEMISTMQNMKNEGVKLVSSKLDDGGTGSYDPQVLTTTKDVIAQEPLPLACVLVNRRLFDNIGGFIKPYYPFSYEDQELFWRMKIKGYKQAISSKALVHHEGGSVAKQLMNEHEKEIEENRQKFIEDVRSFAKKNNYT